VPRPLDGPRRPPARGGKARSLVILLHGYGASGDDLIALADEWRRMLPDTAFVAPHAPERLSFSGAGGCQWFALQTMSPDELKRGVERAGPPLETFIASELRRHDLSNDRLALAGFSQGTMMALHAGLAMRTPPAAILGYSGMLAVPPATDGPRPPVMLIHGDADQVIPVEALHMTREVLAQAGVLVEWHVRRGLAHGIDPEAIAFGGSFMAQMLGQRARKPGPQA
jgi:phospholipase/carboxylesterase